MGKKCYNKVTFENFRKGLTVYENLTFKHVKGGVKLVEEEFTIKDIKTKKMIQKFDNNALPVLLNNDSIK